METRILGFAAMTIAVLLAAPLALAETSGTLTVDFTSPGSADFRMDATATDNEAQELRTQIDSEQFGAGNGDGMVTEDEVATFENQFKSLANSFGQGSDFGDEFTMDGQSPNDAELVELDIRNAEGPVASTAPVDLHLVFRITFPVLAGDRHVLRIAGAEGAEDDEPFETSFRGGTLEAPKGYIIESHAGLPSGAVVAGDKKSIIFGSDLTSAEGTTVVFVKGGGGMAPGWGALGAFGALAAAIMVGGRRPR